MTPYVGTVFDLTLEIVNSPDAATKDQELWLAVLRMLGKSFEVDVDEDRESSYQSFGYTSQND
jgi:hypothetical protein